MSEFNPMNEAFKKVEDLPTDEKEKFVDVTDGFTYKEAVHNLTEAEGIAEIHNALHDQRLSAIDVLHGEARRIEVAKDVNKAIKEWNEFKEKFNAQLTSNGFYDSNDWFEDRMNIRDILRQRYDRIPEELADNRPAVIFFAKIDYRYLADASEDLRNDPDVILTVLEESSQRFDSYNNGFLYASDELKHNKDFVLKALAKSVQVFEYLPDGLKGDPDILRSISQENLSFVAMNLMEYSLTDKDLVSELVQKDGMILRAASMDIRADKNIVLMALKTGTNNEPSHLLEYVSAELRGDKEVALEAVGNDEKDFLNVSEGLKDDKDVVIKVVSHDESGNVLQYASSRMRSDREVVSAAIKRNGKSIRWASEGLKGDKRLVLEAINENPEAFGFVPDELRGDKEVALRAVERNGWAIQIVSDELKKDRELALAAVKQQGSVLRCLPREMRDDKDVVMQAIMDVDEPMLNYSFQFASVRLRRDLDVLFSAMSHNIWSMQYVPKKSLSDKTFMLSVLEKYPYQAVRSMGDSLKSDKDFMLIAVQKDSEALNYASEPLKNDMELVLAAVRHDGNSLQFASREIREKLRNAA